jgi:hypothetical protein
MLPFLQNLCSPCITCKWNKTLSRNLSLKIKSFIQTPLPWLQFPHNKQVLRMTCYPSLSRSAWENLVKSRVFVAMHCPLSTLMGQRVGLVPFCQRGSKPNECECFHTLSLSKLRDIKEIISAILRYQTFIIPRINFISRTNSDC